MCHVFVSKVFFGYVSDVYFSIIFVFCLYFEVVLVFCSRIIRKHLDVSANVVVLETYSFVFDGNIYYILIISLAIKKFFYSSLLFRRLILYRTNCLVTF